MFDFKITKKSKLSKARVGKLTTPHGEIETPTFMPVGTVGAVKTMAPWELKETGAKIILANTYHLYLRPGEKIIKKSGGLHCFMRWKGPILTDSGGFQVFSLGKTKRPVKESLKVKPAQVSEEGVTFYSHLDGSKHFITPEQATKIQEDLGADIIMAFDDCPSANSSRRQVEQAVARTHLWLKRCLKAKKRKDQALFGICQGAIDENLRKISAHFINKLDLPGNAIGGVAVGESKKNIYRVTNLCTDILAENKPRYLMGLGYPEDMVMAISLGIDMFDCVLPTRLARHGVIWIRSSANITKFQNLKFGYRQLDLKKSASKFDLRPVDKNCRCLTCQNGFPRAYLRHLLFEKEPLGIHLLTIHNLTFVYELISQVKEGIKRKSF